MMNTDFNVKFGHVGYLMPDGGLSYEKADTGELFLFPKEMTEVKIKKLMQKSLDDNYDYIFDIVKNNKFEYQEDCEY